MQRKFTKRCTALYSVAFALLRCISRNYLTFLEGESFEDVIRTAVSLGGDCDTLTCIAGAIAEGFYGVPEELKADCRKRLDQKMAEILRRFDEYILFQKQMMEMD